MTRTASRPRRFLPRLERLEDRTTPATITVTNGNDAGAGSLREAIAQANGNAEPDTIQFQAGITTVTLTSANLTLSAAQLTTINGNGVVVQRSKVAGTPEFGIFLLNSASVQVAMHDLSIRNGVANFGGGISNSGTLTLTNCALNANTATNLGGAILNNVTLSMTNCTVSSNSAENNGGGIFSNGTMTLVNCTIANNRADSGVGGGISGVTGTKTLRNTIVAGNFKGTGTTATDIEGGTITTATFNLIGDAATAGGIVNGVNDNKVGVNPLLGPFADYGGLSPTHAIPVSSPAFNAGNNADVPAGVTTDQRGAGFERFAFGSVDIGAFEFQAPTANPLVVDNAGDAFDGNFSAGNLTLREAVATANGRAGADTITFAPGITTVTLTSAQLTLTDAALTTINGGSGVTITRSTAAGTPNFRLFQMNSGVNAELIALTLTNGNPGSNGGAIVKNGAGSVVITNSTLSANNANTGGAVSLTGGTTTITGSTISGNTALAAGGIAVASASLTLIQSTISGNSATLNGGGIGTNATATLTVINSTITSNRANADGAGSETGGGIHALGNETLFNTLVAGNFKGTETTPSDIEGGTINTFAFNLIGDAATSGGITNNVNNNKVGIDPLLGPLQNNGGPTQTHAIPSSSPAFNAGNNANVPAGITTDQRGAGFERFAFGKVDIGAFEVQPPAANPLVVNNAGDAFDGDFSAGNLTLREAVAIASGRGADTITFASGISTVTLTSTELTLTDNDLTTITGNGVTVTRSAAAGTPDFRLFVISPGASATLTGLTLSNGRGNLGGGLLNSGTLTITHSTITGNVSTIFAPNIPDGGGIFNNGTLTVTNSTISGNSAERGGGIFNNNNGTLTVINSTITSNRANADGAGSETGGGVHALGNETLFNTLVAGNFKGTETTPSDIEGGTINTFAFNLIGDAATSGGITNNVNNNKVGVNPLLGPLQNNGGPTFTHLPAANSPAVNAGDNNSAAGLVDQRGFGPRIVGGIIDIGSVEVGASASLPPAVPSAAIAPPAPVLLRAVAFKQKGKSKVRVFDAATNQLRRILTPFPGFTGRLQVQLLDVNNDGSADLIVQARVNKRLKRKTFNAITLNPLS